MSLNYDRLQGDEENGGGAVDQEHRISETVVDGVVDNPKTALMTDYDDEEEAAKPRGERARRAYDQQDVELSKIVHDNTSIAAPESHQGEGGYVKAVVFGGLDGIITAFASVSSVVGADYSTGVIFVLGFASLFANAISMGIGELLSEKAEREWTMKERQREAWEFEHAPEAEIKEMVDLYKEKGFSEQEAETVLRIMAKYKDFFVDHMLVQELGIMPPEDGDSMAPIKQGLVMFFSFIAFGLIPLISYLALSSIHFNSFDPRFLVACIMTGIALFVLGALKSKFSHDAWYTSGLVVMIFGSIAAAVGFGISYGLEKIVPAGSC